MSDLINRQYAIRCIKEMASCADIVHEGKDYAYIIRHYSGNLTVDMHNIWDLFEEIIADLPSAEPNIVRCRDCKHWQNEHLCRHFSKHGTIETSADDYCSYAERKEE